jgi:hypothetical protein
MYLEGVDVIGKGGGDGGIRIAREWHGRRIGTDGGRRGIDNDTRPVRGQGSVVEEARDDLCQPLTTGEAPASSGIRHGAIRIVVRQEAKWEDTTARVQGFHRGREEGRKVARIREDNLNLPV